ncbi:MAG: transketolase C-terminal domain-containing protein [Candidatus Odinarchaeia archaeon]
MKKILTGNYSIAEAVKQCNVKFIAAYPITPQTTIVEALARMVKCGSFKSKFLRVESEHSAMAACIGAASIGVRTFTATSSHGLAYMHELLYWAAASRLPIVMVNVNRALAPPWNIWVEHTDSLIERDVGWIQLYASTNQEAYDLVFQAYKLSESNDILLPTMLCIDGFLLSHTAGPVEIIPEEKLNKFLPELKIKRNSGVFLDVDNPETYGNIIPVNSNYDFFYEFRFKAHQAMKRVEKKFTKITQSFYKLTSRNYGNLTSPYLCEDADYVLISMGTLANICKKAVIHLRNKNIKIGALRIRCVRPFPEKEIIDLLQDKKALFIIDRDLVFGVGGVLTVEINSILKKYDIDVKVIPAIGGLGGRDITLNQILDFINSSIEAMSLNKKFLKPYWIGLRRDVL